jgi:hypothetical protein
MRNFLKATLGLVVLGMIAWGIYEGLCAIARYIRSLDSDLSKALIAAAAAVIGSVITISIGKAYESRAATIKELRAKKAPIYEEIVHGSFNVLFAEILGVAKPSESEMMTFFVKMTETLTIWGSNDVVKAFGKFKTVSTNPNQTMYAFEDFMFAMRRDLGHNGNLERGSLLRLFVTDIDEILAGKK